MGRYIVFEGIDGSGKTTLMKMLRQHLQAHCSKRGLYLDDLVKFVKEPGDNPHGLNIRRWLNKEIELTPKQQLELFAADRYWSYQQHIAPAVYEGRSVISDRCFISTMVYQPFTHEEVFNAMTDTIGSNIVPHIVVYLRYDLDKFNDRMRSADDNKDDRFYISKEVYDHLTGRYEDTMNAIREGKIPLRIKPQIIELWNNDTLDDLLKRLLEVIDINVILR